MSLCDTCITVLKNDLSEEAIQILNKIELFNELSERDIVRKLSLNHKHVKKLLYELEVKLLLNYDSYGRTKAYHLTENGSRLLRLEEDETELEIDLKTEQEETVVNDTSNNDCKDNKQAETEIAQSTNTAEESVTEAPNEEEDSQETTAVENNDVKTSNKKSKNLVWEFE